MKELILMIAKSVVAKPGEVDEVKGKKTTVLELRVFKEFFGVCQGQKKMWLEGYIYKKKFIKQSMFQL